MKIFRFVKPWSMFRDVLILSAAIALAACAPFQPYAETASPDHYIVQPGDNLHSIAFALETTPQALLRENPWANSLELSPGTRFTVPRGARGESLASVPSYGGVENESSGSETRIQDTDYIWPLRRYDVSSRYGRRWGRFHRGIDLRAPRGTPILAVADGKVKVSSRGGAYGNRVVINHGGGIETVYAHNLRNLVARGQWVEQGEVIAQVGRSGNATGYHLHFEFRRNGRALNPVRQIQVALD
jgi:murein DD-endopeptidase MepM/ murein hydrolase activator NlpD